MESTPGINPQEINTEIEQRNLSLEIAQVISSFYGLGEVDDVAKISTGLSNDNYFLRRKESDSAIHVVRVIKNYNQNLIVNEIYIQQLLKKHDVKSNYLLPNHKGEYIYSGKNVTAVISEKLLGDHPEEVTEVICTLVGKLLGKYHQFIDTLPHNNGEILLNPLNVKNHLSALDESKERSRLFELFNSCSDLLDKNLPAGIIHGDLHRENLLVDKDQNIAVLDVEHSGQGILILDIARSIADLCRSGERLNKKKLHAFLNGYNTSRIITELELVSLYHAVGMSCVAVATWFYEHKYSKLGDIFTNIGFNEYKNIYEK